MIQYAEHDESKWQHAMCEACWSSWQPGRTPVRVRGDVMERCCECGSRTTSGIYVRRAAEELSECPLKGG